MKQLIDDIMVQLSGKTFHDTDSVNTFFRKSLEHAYVAGKTYGMEYMAKNNV
jgi:hypothetical protein